MNAIYRLFRWLMQCGRQWHLLAGLAILFLGLLLCVFAFGLGIYAAAGAATGAVLLTMVLKELYDLLVKGTFFDWTDIAAGMLFPALLWVCLGIGSLLVALGLE